MRAAVYGATHPEGIFVKTRSIPKRSGRHGVLVKVKAAGVNPVDSKFVFGDKLPQSAVGFAKWFVGGKTAGFDFAGVVEEVPNGSKLQPGDEVFGCCPPFVGSFCDYVNVPDDQISIKPKSLSFVEAAALGIAGLTCVQAFAQHGLQAEQRLLVIGASGGVGHMATCIAALMGADVYGVCSGRNVEFVQGLGAKHVIDYTEGNVIMALQEQVSKHGLFDMVLDTVTSHDSRDMSFGYEKSIRSEPATMAKGAMYIKIGAAHTSSWCVAGTKRITGVNLFGKGQELFWVRFPHSTEDLDQLRALADEKHFKPVIDTVVPLTSEGVQGAFRSLVSRRTRGKIVIDMDLEAKPDTDKTPVVAFSNESKEGEGEA